MTERVTNADIAATLARLDERMTHLVAVVGEKPGEGLRGDVAMLVGIKNKGWGLVVGLLLLAGGVGAALKAVFADLLK
ncbi:hypothetical protein ABE444_10845 [Brevundimonas pondensis]|uniref:hypothetical protein n=1 Tax=Brevundimonas pondensis TaxID=2774189 RepID=UPI00320B9883